MVKLRHNKKKTKRGEIVVSRMEVLMEQISKAETAELTGQEFQLAVLTALLQVFFHPYTSTHGCCNINIITSIFVVIVVLIH